MLLLNQQDIQSVFTMADAIEADKRAFRFLSENQCDIPLRTNINIPKYGGQALFMPGYVPGMDAVGVKIVSVFPGNAALGLPSVPAQMILVDGKTGMVCCILDGTTLTRIRTGAAAGAATDVLARKDSQIGALIGTGGQAQAQLEAMLTVRTLDEVRVYSRSAANTKAFIEINTDLMSRFATRIVAVDSSEAAVRDADIITAVTTSKQPVFDGHWIKKGAHVNGVGSYTPEMHEMDAYLLLQAEGVYADTREGVLAEAGDLLTPMAQGLFGTERITGELGDVLLNRVHGRIQEDAITVFKSVGTAVLDIVAAQEVYRLALEKGIGTHFDL